MANASEPQTDRELLLNLNNKVNSIQMVFDGKIDRLTDSINRLNDTFVELEEKRVGHLERRMDAFDEWRSELKGGWKIIAIVFTGTAALVAFIVKYWDKIFK